MFVFNQFDSVQQESRAALSEERCVNSVGGVHNEDIDHVPVPAMRRMVFVIPPAQSRPAMISPACPASNTVKIFLRRAQ